VLALTRVGPKGRLEAHTDFKTAVPGKGYTAMADLGGVADLVVVVSLEFFNDADTLVHAVEDEITTEPNALLQAAIWDTAPEDATKVRLRISAEDVERNQTLKVDKVALMQGIATEWLPGG